MSDGKTLVAIPPVQAPSTAEEEGLPEIADWELQTPHGLVSVGPGLHWTLKPKQGESPKY
jgi:hypothetical protein